MKYRYRIMRRATKGSEAFALCIDSGDYPASLEPRRYFELVFVSPSLRRYIGGKQSPAATKKRVAAVRSTR
jgi:hypothetical protein